MILFSDFNSVKDQAVSEVEGEEVGRGEESLESIVVDNEDDDDAIVSV